MFTTFKRELSNHRDGGYHHLAGKLERNYVVSWFEKRAIQPPESYVDFLCEIGPGSFFGGALTIYQLGNDRVRSVESELSRLRDISPKAIFPFGYDGTSESCYCLENGFGQDVVSWFSWEEKISRPLDVSFQKWIENLPSELFKESIYTGYKKLENIDELISVMEDRAAFNIRLASFEKQLLRPPSKPNDLLPRYNKLELEVTKTHPVGITELTVAVARIGSRIGASNIEYATFPVHDLILGAPTIRECYVFDPFNVPFTDIEVQFNPVIDLGSKMRVKFKELSSFL